MGTKRTHATIGRGGVRTRGTGEATEGRVDAVISSPPFTQGYAGGGGFNVKGYGPDSADKVESGYQGTAASAAGNLEALTLGAVDAVISSPPYESGGNSNSEVSTRSRQRSGACEMSRLVRRAQRMGPRLQKHRWATGAKGGRWQAADTIVASATLLTSGFAVWVVKAFVRNKTVVDFPGDWRRLCEHAGFETVEEIHASLVSEEVRPGLFGDTTHRRERKSFFRRLAESKGSPRIDWETVWVMRKGTR